MALLELRCRRQQWQRQKESREFQVGGSTLGIRALQESRPHTVLGG
jgi:hypothetical protein